MKVTAKVKKSGNSRILKTSERAEFGQSEENETRQSHILQIGNGFFLDFFV
jgi:hypothetical protein